MGLRKMNRSPYGHSNIARRTFLYNELKEEQLLVIIPQEAFNPLLKASPNDVSAMVKTMILYLISDAESHPCLDFEDETLQETWATMITTMQQYMSTFRTRKRRSATAYKRKMTEENIPVDESDVGPVSITDHAANSSKGISERLKSIIKRPEDMPIFDDL